MKITAIPNKEKNGFSVPSPYNKKVLKDWLKQYPTFSIQPIVKEPPNKRRYLEGAIIPAYAHWQYGIDPRDPGLAEQRRYLFKRDFNFEVIKDRYGNPVRTVLSTKGKTKEIIETYVSWAMENGAPVPNPELFKTYRDMWASDLRFPTFHDWLEHLTIECDAMLSSETIDRLIIYGENAKRINN